MCVFLYFQKDREGSVKNVPQQNVDGDIWVPDYLTPSWVCLPNNRPVLAIIQPGETTLEVLSNVCKVGHIAESAAERTHSSIQGIRE